MSVRVMRWGRVWVAAASSSPAVFAEFGWDVVEVEGFVDLLFVGGGDYGVVLDAEEGVLVEGEAAFDGSLAEGYVVHLGAGEVLEGCSVAAAGE